MMAHGFAGVSMDHVAAALGMSKKTLYQQFSSKRRLELAVVEHFFRNVDKSIAGAMNEANDIEDQFLAFFRVLRTRLSQVNLPAIENLELRNPELWHHINEHREKMIGRHLGLLIVEGQRSGLLRDDIPAETVIRIVITIVLQMATPGRLLAYQGGIEQFMSHFMSLLLYGIRRQPE